jgi:hypothetical protein
VLIRLPLSFSIGIRNCEAISDQLEEYFGFKEQISLLPDILFNQSGRTIIYIQEYQTLFPVLQTQEKRWRVNDVYMLPCRTQQGARKGRFCRGLVVNVIPIESSKTSVLLEFVAPAFHSSKVWSPSSLEALFGSSQSMDPGQTLEGPQNDPRGGGDPIIVPPELIGQGG